MIDFIHGDARDYECIITARSFVVIDPPWDSPELFKVGSKASNRLVFCDGKRLGDAVNFNGPPTWVFVWDCVTSWYTPNRPLKRGKMALWYGDLTKYNQCGSHYGEPCGRPRIVRNSRGTHFFTPDGRGKMLSDVFQQPITQLRQLNGQQFNQSKPYDWIRMLTANCRGDCNSIVDLFAGSGVFARAAIDIGLDYVGIESDTQRYNDLINMRFDQTITQHMEQTSWL